MSDEPETRIAHDADETLRRLWSRPAPNRRGPKPALSVDAVVEAAVTLADAEGLAAASMSRIANSLGCTAMALYRHVRSKDELLALLADRVAAEGSTIPDGLRWREGLTQWVRIQIAGILAHPWVLDLPLASLPLGPNRTRWIDQGFRVMDRLDLPTDQKALIISVLSEHVLAEARVLAQLQAASTNPFTDLARNIHTLADVETLPHLFAILAEPPTDTGSEDFGIELILDGVAARLRRHRRTTRR